MIDSLDICSRDLESLLGRMNVLVVLYIELSDIYQTNKSEAGNSLA
jgi:hypothetical protein